MKDVIVIGGNHHNTLGVLRSLGEKGLFPTLILVTTEHKPFVGYCKYVIRKILICKDDLIPETLLSQCKRDDYKPVVISCSDSSMSIIDENRNRLFPFFHIPGSDEQGRISYLMNKKVMAHLAAEVGMQIPITCYGDEIEKVMDFPLPCIVKPLISSKGSKTDIHICQTWGEVKTNIEKIGARNVQIQQFIDKDFEYQLIGCATSTEVIIPGVSKILRPCKGSNTSYLHYVSLEDGFCEIEKCKEFVKRTGYHGLFSLEFLRDKNGQDFFMEINFRNDGNAICVTAAGVNLPYIWYLSCVGDNYQTEKNRKITPIYVMPDMAEFKLLITRQIGILDYMKDLKMTGRFMEYDKNDPKPFWRMIRTKLHLW